MKRRHAWVGMTIGGVLCLLWAGCTAPGPGPVAETAAPSPTAAPTQAADTAAAPEPTASAPAPAEPTPTEPAPAPTEAAPSPTPSTAPDTQPTPGGGSQAGPCQEKAAFYADISIPDDTPVEQGERFVKTWQLRNVGTCTWRGYALIFAGGELMSAPLSVPIPETAPDGLVEVSVEFQAPGRGGPALGNWLLEDAAGQQFGVGASGNGPVWVSVQVAFNGNEQLPILTPTAPNAGGGGGGGGGANIDPCAGADRNVDFERAVVDAINRVRSQNGLAALAPNPALAAAAVRHSMDMACANYMGHDGSDGSTWYSRVAAEGYANFNSARENVYAGPPAFGGTPDGAMGWWLNSQVHRNNILNANVSEIGVGYVFRASAQFGGYYTTVLARP